MHLDVEQLERLAHGELDAGREAELREHVRGCAHCERRFGEAVREDAEIGALLRHLDHPAPAIGGDAVVLRSRRGRWGTARIAAALALTLAAAGVLSALPGSPLRDLLHRTPRGAGSAPPAESTAVRSSARPAPAGITVPVGATLTVVLPEGQRLGSVTVTLDDASGLSIRSTGAEARFDLGVDRVTVVGDAPDYVILVPRGAPSVRVFHGVVVVWEKSGDRVRSVVEPAPDGSYRVPLGAGVR